MMAGVEQIQVVVAHSERATVRVGDVFLKIDADQARTDAEVQAMALAPVPTPEILWRRPPVLALAAVPGRALGRLQEPSTASPAAWAAAGAAIRTLHDAPLPPRPGTSVDDLATLTLAHEEHLHDVIVGYGRDVDLDVIRAWWSFRSLVAIRWLAQNGYG